MKIEEFGREVNMEGVDSEIFGNLSSIVDGNLSESQSLSCLGSGNLSSNVKEGREEACDRVGNLSCCGVERGNLNCLVKVEGEEIEKVEDLSYCRIEDELVKVCLIDGDDEKGSKAVSDGDESGSSDSGSASSSSSSSESSSSEDEEDDEAEEEDDDDDGEDDEAEEEDDGVEKETIDFEEGEVRDIGEEEMVGWVDDAEDDIDGVGVIVGPIMSKNEVKNLPPVPPVEVTLQPDHQTLPVGIVLSIIGAQVIVEGVEKHEPLNEGSILWITETRTPLGLVDEIFGPVKNPYYIVRYNSEVEVPSKINEGAKISFVQEFANHVLNQNNLYKKGYDASGENDEELSEELEFSDDEKEAEYRRMMKATKRGTDDQMPGKGKKDKRDVKNRNGNWKNNQPLTPRGTTEGVSPLPQNQNQHHNALPPVKHLDHGNFSCPPGTGQVFNSMVQPFPQIAQASNFAQPSGGVWANGMPYQQQQSTPWVQQNHHQHPYQQQQQQFHPNGMLTQQQFNQNGMMMQQQLNQNGMMSQQPFNPNGMMTQQPFNTNGMMTQQPFNPNGMMTQQQLNPNAMQIQQQFNPNGMQIPQHFNPNGMQMVPNNGVPGGQSNFFAGPTYAPWQGQVPNGFNQMTSGMGFQGQHTQPSMNVGMSNGSQTTQQPSVVPGNIQQFNAGASQATPQPSVVPGNIQQFNASASQATPQPSVPRNIQQFNAGESQQPSVNPVNSTQQFNADASFGREKKPFHRSPFYRSRGRGHASASQATPQPSVPRNIQQFNAGESQQPSVNPVNISQQFNADASVGREKKPFHRSPFHRSRGRGRGRFAGGRGRH